MTSLTGSDFDFAFLEEGFCARDIVDQKINESLLSVSEHVVLYLHVCLIVAFFIHVNLDFAIIISFSLNGSA